MWRQERVPETGKRKHWGRTRQQEVMRRQERMQRQEILRRLSRKREKGMTV